MSGLNRLWKRKSGRLVIGIILATLVCWSCSAKAEHKLKDEDCLQCHSDKTLTKDVNGKQVSLFVDGAKLKHSIHGGMFGCVDCHTDVKSMVHDVLPKKITCAQCYAEKAEYWALVWGTALMGLTGVMMWAKVWIGDLFARWWVDVATAVHFYEAILATLAIVVWHFYQVFFDPDVYPMNWSWWDGKMPVEQYRHEHELDDSEQ